VEKSARIFESFEEADAADLLSRSQMSPEERVAIFFAIRESAFPDALSKDLLKFVECLNSNEVEYLIVGALAVSWHGFPRYSGDIDFFLHSSRTNAERVLQAIRQFGFGSLDIGVDDLMRTWTSDPTRERAKPD